jgi:hypothetical protein
LTFSNISADTKSTSTSSSWNRIDGGSCPPTVSPSMSIIFSVQCVRAAEPRTILAKQRVHHGHPRCTLELVAHYEVRLQRVAVENLIDHTLACGGVVVMIDRRRHPRYPHKASFRLERDSTQSVCHGCLQHPSCDGSRVSSKRELRRIHEGRRPAPYAYAGINDLWVESVGRKQGQP